MRYCAQFIGIFRRCLECTRHTFIEYEPVSIVIDIGATDVKVLWAFATAAIMHMFSPSACLRGGRPIEMCVFDV